MPTARLILLPVESLECRNVLIDDVASKIYLLNLTAESPNKNTYTWLIILCNTYTWLIILCNTYTWLIILCNTYTWLIILCNTYTWLIILCRNQTYKSKVHYHIGLNKCEVTNSRKAVHHYTLFFREIASLLILCF